MKLLFIVQGEGRGHLTQALSMWQQLRDSPHEVVACLIGKEMDKIMSEIINTEISAPVHFFQSPNLVYNQSGKGLSMSQTLRKNGSQVSTYTQSLKKINNWVKEYTPDLILNFYDFLAGIYQVTYPFSAPPMVCVGHQYLLLHHQFKFPEGRKMDRILVNLNSRITALGAKKMLALSFSPLSRKKKLISIPPLIRNAVLNEPIEEFNYFLAYVTNANLLSQLMEWHKTHTDIEIHCFVKRVQENEVEQLQKNLFVHKLNFSKFLRLMAKAKGLITTAGFESVCEAIYFGKPVMMVPVPNHFEQACNALDAERFGAGIAQDSFNLDAFLSYTNTHKGPTSQFRDWLKQGKSLLLQELEGISYTIAP